MSKQSDFDKEIEILMNRLQAVVQKHQPRRTAYEQVSILGLRAVDVLHRHAKPMTMSELSISLDINLSSASVVVNRLVKLKYVERIEPGSDDRRIVRIQLTKEAGTNLIESRRKQMLQLYKIAAADMTVQELSVITKFFGKMIDVMSDSNEK